MKSVRFSVSFSALLALMVVLAGLFAASLSAQQAAKTPQGTVERITVHGNSLEGNLEGDSPDRAVSVYLPPSYKTARNRRYPVIYLLHGFTDNDDNWFGRRPHFISVPAAVNKALAGGDTREMIVVMPNAFTAYQGSMYGNSVTTGNWEDFIAKELVAYIDSHYRTIAEPASRGLAGHSMGGYGTIRIGMKFPDVFSSIYSLSPCCMAASEVQPAGAALKAAEAITSAAEIEKANFGTKAMVAFAAAFSPNPKKPPLFYDLPAENGKVRPDIVAKWAANAPLAMIDQYVGNLKRLKAIAFDAGEQDRSIAATIKTLDEVLNDYKVPHTFEIYQGDHVNHIADRVETKMLPFFSKTLSFSQGRGR